MEAFREAEPATRAANVALLGRLPKETGQDLDDVSRGFIGTIPDAKITGADGRAIWDMGQFAFEAGDAECPDTVNPSLWRQAKLNSQHGLFEVTPGVYQVRNFDLSNITFLEGERGYLIVDPLISSETAAAALALMRHHRGD